MIGDILKSLKEQEEKRFTPDKMRDAAKLLRLASNIFAKSTMKEKCLKYADMLDSLAQHEDWKRKTFEAEWERQNEEWKALQEARDSW
jgi:hypothetical protein